MLQSTWFILVFVLLIGYAILDGFDLGVGVLHLFARGDRERRLGLNAIGPVWDGNEVWLLTGGGALFAAFPAVYATVFSGFYLALMLLLAALIARAVAMEFRSKIESPTWRAAWDWAFALGSCVPALLLGVAFGNILRGIPLDKDGQFTGTFFTLLNPYALLVGVLGLVAFTLHGAVYLASKTDGELCQRLASKIFPLWLALLVLYAITTAASMTFCPTLFACLRSPLAWLLILLVLASLTLIPVFSRQANYKLALVASSTAIGSMLALGASGLFPRLVPAINDPNLSLTAFNSSSSPRTLAAMLVIALIGMPVVLAYTAFVYRVFKGKVQLTEESY